MPADLVDHFPGLRQTRWQKTSREDILYNCIAWAANDTQNWWSPFPPDYWPPGVPREHSLAAFVQAFATLGYAPCTTPDLEPGFEKVVIYVNVQDIPTHMARQLANGRWTSKLGEWEDISHESLQGVGGNPPSGRGWPYGRVAQFMRRPNV